MTTSSVPGPRETGLAAAKIAEQGGPNAIDWLVTFMAANEREAEWCDGVILRGVERERDEWQQRALAAEDRLRRIENRIWDLLG